MNNQATILPFNKQSDVKRLLTPQQKEIVSLVSQVIVQKTFNDAEKIRTVPALQQRWAKQQ